MKYEYQVFKTQLDGEEFWVAKSLVLSGCVAQAETEEEAYKGLEEAENAWLETAEELGWKIPSTPLRQIRLHSGKVALRISPMIHREAADYADQLGISLNQYIGDALAAYNAQVGSFLYQQPAKNQNSADLVPSKSTIIHYDDIRREG